MTDGAPLLTIFASARPGQCDACAGRDVRSHTVVLCPMHVAQVARAAGLALPMGSPVGVVVREAERA